MKNKFIDIIRYIPLKIREKYQYIINNQQNIFIRKLFKALGRDGFLVAIGSLCYGFQIFRHPHILSTYQVYQFVHNIADNRLIGLVFMTVGLLKIVGAIFDIAILRKVGLLGMSFMWGVFFVSFLISPPPNTIWTLALTMCLILVRASIREDG